MNCGFFITAQLQHLISQYHVLYEKNVLFNLTLNILIDGKRTLVFCVKQLMRGKVNMEIS